MGVFAVPPIHVPPHPGVWNGLSWPEEVPHGRRMRDFAGLREWMAQVERDLGREA